MHVHVYTYRFTITNTCVDVYTVGTTRTHIKSCPSIPTHTPPCNIEPYVHARAVAQSTAIGVLCCARTWPSTPWQTIIAEWRSSVLGACNGKHWITYFRGWNHIIGSRTILTASPWKAICIGIQKNSGQKDMRGDSITKRSFRSSHPKGSLRPCMTSCSKS